MTQGAKVVFVASLELLAATLVRPPPERYPKPSWGGPPRPCDGLGVAVAVAMAVAVAVGHTPTALLSGMLLVASASPSEPQTKYDNQGWKDET